MASLALREQLLLAFIIGAFLTGAAVHHWRDAHRPSPPAAGLATP